MVSRLPRSSPLAVGAFLFTLTTLAASATTGTALVERAPQINGRVEGSIQQFLPQHVRLNGGAVVTGDLLVPGLPNVRQNGNPDFDGVLEGEGPASPSNYQVTLNGNASLRHLIVRTEAASLPLVTAPPQPGGHRSVNINSSSDSPGNFATLRNLTLNGGGHLHGFVRAPNGSKHSVIINCLYNHRSLVLG